MTAVLHARPIGLVYDGPDAGRGTRVDHIFWAVLSIAILGVLMSLLLKMLIEDFVAGHSSGRQTPTRKS
jgi:hypothetical protein